MTTTSYDDTDAVRTMMSGMRLRPSQDDALNELETLQEQMVEMAKRSRFEVGEAPTGGYCFQAENRGATVVRPTASGFEFLDAKDGSPLGPEVEYFWNPITKKLEGSKGENALDVLARNLLEHLREL